jgi:hypothetical protein
VDLHSVTKRFALNMVQRVVFGSSLSYSDNEANDWSLKVIRQVDVVASLFGPNVCIFVINTSSRIRN